MQPRERASSIFKQVGETFPEFAMHHGQGEDGEPRLGIPAQAALHFEVVLYLYADALHLCADQFCGEWFPCSSWLVVEEYHDAVTGLLSGRYRIVQHSRRGKPLKAVLQRPSSPGWSTVYRHYQSLALPWLSADQRILQSSPSNEARDDSGPGLIRPPGCRPSRSGRWKAP